jgi:hypothetical protein
MIYEAIPAAGATQNVMANPAFFGEMRFGLVAPTTISGNSTCSHPEETGRSGAVSSMQSCVAGRPREGRADKRSAIRRERRRNTLRYSALPVYYAAAAIGTCDLRKASVGRMQSAVLASPERRRLLAKSREDDSPRSRWPTLSGFVSRASPIRGCRDQPYGDMEKADCIPPTLTEACAILPRASRVLPVDVPAAASGGAKLARTADQRMPMRRPRPATEAKPPAIRTTSEP